MLCAVKRDIAERGRSVDDVLHQYLYTVKPAFDEFIAPVRFARLSSCDPFAGVRPHRTAQPLIHIAHLSVSVTVRCCCCVQTKRYADIIIPRGGENLVAIDLLVQHIKRQLRKRGVQIEAAQQQQQLQHQQQMQQQQQASSNNGTGFSHTAPR